MAKKLLREKFIIIWLLWGTFTSTDVTPSFFRETLLKRPFNKMYFRYVDC